MLLSAQKQGVRTYIQVRAGYRQCPANTSFCVLRSLYASRHTRGDKYTIGILVKITYLLKGMKIIGIDTS